MSFTSQFVVGPFVYLFNAFIRRTELMATIVDIKAVAEEVNVILDEVAVIVANLKAGQASQAEIDAAFAAVEGLKVKASALKA